MSERTSGVGQFLGLRPSMARKASMRTAVSESGVVPPMKDMPPKPGTEPSAPAEGVDNLSNEVQDLTLTPQQKHLEEDLLGLEIEEGATANRADMPLMGPWGNHGATSALASMFMNRSAASSRPQEAAKELVALFGGNLPDDWEAPVADYATAMRLDPEALYEEVMKLVQD